MRARAYLELGRVSNLPTVWTNVLAGAALSGAAVTPGALALPLLAGSLFYTGGMFLNDAFDREIDRRERPERPIPSGRVRAREVFATGYGMLAAAWMLLLLQWRGLGHGSERTLAAGAALAGAIVLYNAWHKGNPWSPVLMGLCRALLYLTAGLAVAGRPSAALASGALVLLAYLIGLTYTAKQESLSRVENLWPLALLAAPLLYSAPAAVQSPLVAAFFLLAGAWITHAVRMIVRQRSIPRAVIAMIAGISLVDALLIARTGAAWLAAIAALGLLGTLALQRFVRGT